MRRSLASLFVLLLTLSLVSLGRADAAPSKTGQIAGQPSSLVSGITQSYNADGSVQSGMIVKLNPRDPSSVVPLDNASISNLLGVVVPPANAAIVLTPQQAKQRQVLVSTSGRYQVLVSNQDGPIKTGDYITISAIAGVGMKADDQQTLAIGRAAGDFSGSSNVIGTVNLTDSRGHKVTVGLGSILVDLAISHNPLYQKPGDYVPGFLAKVATTVSGKPVSVARIYLGLAVIFVTTALAGNTLYSGVRSGMIAIGRNPLSKKSIIRSLIEAVVAGVIIFVVGVFAVYLLLKL